MVNSEVNIDKITVSLDQIHVFFPVNPSETNRKLVNRAVITENKYN